MSRKFLADAIGIVALLLFFLSLSVIVSITGEIKFANINIYDAPKHFVTYYFLMLCALMTFQRIRKLDIFFGVLLLAVFSQAISFGITHELVIKSWIASIIGAMFAIAPLYSRDIGKKPRVEKRKFHITPSSKPLATSKI